MKLKSAAAQIALGLVRQDAIPGLNFRSSSNSLSGSLEKLDFSLDHTCGFPEMKPPRSSLKLDVVLDSPVIVLPRNRNSPEVLVANLGQISVVGKSPMEESILFPNSSLDEFDGELREDAISYNIFVCDISLYSLNLSDRWKMVNNLKMTYPTASSTTLMRAQELYMCDHSSAIPILHNTVVHLNISYMDEPNSCDCEGTGDYDEPTENGEKHSQLQIQGRVVSALKVSLTPKQYAQVLDSLGNIAANEDNFDTNEVSVTERRVNWQKEVHHLRGTRSKEPLPLPSPTHHADDSLPIKSSFDISELIVELALPIKTQTPLRTDTPVTPHLTLSCSELSFTCDKRSHQMEMDICLKALKLEDTNVTIDNPRRILASSKPGSGGNSRKTAKMLTQAFTEHISFLSKSCPELQKTTPVSIVESPSQNSGMGVRTESASLPDELDPGTIFQGRFNPVGIAFKPLKTVRKRRASTKRSKDHHHHESHQGCPVTPPPSPRPEDALWDNLVHIKIIMIDPKSPDFITKYSGMHKYTRVDFNILEVLLTPETFACLRQFFSDASKHGQANQASQSQFTQVNEDKQEFFEHEAADVLQRNTETVINVRALMVKLARTSGTIAEAEVNSVHCELKSRGQNYFGVDGRLGSLEIRDLGPYRGLYPLKFVFQGDQALDFDYVRIGEFRCL